MWPLPDNDVQIKSADGGDGANGQTIPSSDMNVVAGDIIIIEVGYGGGGSGGASANDKGNMSSEPANKTIGSLGSRDKASGCSADASSGGVGAMHSFTGRTEPSDLQKGTSSLAVSGTAAALGGQAKGQGGVGGKANTSGGMYASGGGGGAAGGFTMTSSNVRLETVTD